MARRPVLEYSGDHRKRGEDARNRVLSRNYGEQAATRPVLEYTQYIPEEREQLKPAAVTQRANMNERRLSQQDTEPTEKQVTFPVKKPTTTQTISRAQPNAFDVKKADSRLIPVATQEGIGTRNVPTRQEWLDQEAAARDEQLGNAPGIIRKPLQFIGGALDRLQTIPGVSNFQQGAGHTLGIEAQTAPLNNGLVGKSASALGSLAGYGVNPAQIEQNLFNTGYGVANKLVGTNLGQKAVQATQGGVSRAANLANPLLNRAGINIGSNLTNKVGERVITGGIANAIQNTGLEASKGNTDLKDLGTAAALGGAFGAAGDVALHGVGAALSKLFKRNGLPEKEVQEILALPMGREDAARLRRAPQNGSNGVVTPEYTFGLPEPRVNAPVATNARIAQRANPYREKYNQLIGLAHETKFTPGRESEELEQLWSSIAGRNDPSLDELVKLAHPTYFSKVEPGLVSKAKNYQAAREVAGAPLPIKGTEQIPQGVIAEAAPLTQKIGRAPNVVPERVEPIVQSEPVQPMPETQQNPIPEPPPKVANTADDVADDIELPHPDEVSIRVRDRVTSYADEMIAAARKELAKNRNRLSSNPADIYGQYAKMGAGYMLKGTVKLADFTEALVRDFGEEIRPHVKEIFKRAKPEFKALKKQIESEELGLSNFESQKLKDLTNINLNTGDVYRNFAKVFGQHFPEVKKAVLDPFDNAKGSYAQEQKTQTDKLFKEIVKGLGIKKGSKDSALVQKFGEGQITLDQLKAAAPGKWKSIVKADQWFRAQYDDIINRVNESIKKIYPNRPEKLVPKREDYYRHFQDLSGWGGLKNLFDSASGKISPGLSGLSPFTQPKTKWASFKQKRGMGEFKNDAVGGFLEYIPSASYAIHIDPHISTFRNLARHLADETEKTANINYFIKYLNNFANDLSGKTSPFDRWVEEIGGRKTLQILTSFNNRVKKNVILGNIRSSLAQLASIPNGIAFSAADSPAGALRTIESIFKQNEAMAKSNFLKERYLDKSFRRFDTKILQQPKRFAEWTMETMDRVGTSFVWNTAYARGVRKGVADPVRFADENTRKLIGGRGVGEQPLLIKSKVFNLLAPFQLEVNNLWRVMKEFVDEKRFGALATLFAANFLLNKAYEKVTGSRVVFDPINAIYQASTEEDANLLQRFGRVGGEVLSNTPLGSTIASLYPEYGMNLYGAEFPTRKELFGDNDPTRFGSGLLATGGITDPLFKFVLPFGGNQLKKSTQGLDALLREGSYTENVLTTGKTIEGPKLKFPVKPTLGNATRSVLFGPYATTEGHDYTKNHDRPLSETQTQQYLKSPQKEKVFNNMQVKREYDALKAKASKISKDATLSPTKRKEKISEVVEKISKLQKGLLR